MGRALKRWVALVILAAGTFAQASVFALPHEAQSGCEAPQLASLCVAHCTSNLQLSSAAIVLVRSPGEMPALVPPRDPRTVLGGGRAENLPPPHIPIRILLQSFQI